MKRLFVLMVAVVFVVDMSANYLNAAVVLTDPDQLVAKGNTQYITMELGDNLMKRLDSVDSIVDKGVGEYYIFLMKQVAATTVFGGYLTTDNIWSNSGVSGYEGWMDGYIDRDVFLEGDGADKALAIFDPDAEQFAVLSNGKLVLDENLVLYGSGFLDLNVIEYNGVIDGLLSELVFPADSPDTLLFEHTVLMDTPAVPEPGAILLCCFGTVIMLIRKNRYKLCHLK